MIQFFKSSAAVGVAKPISSVPSFSYFFGLTKHYLPIEYHIHIWQIITLCFYICKTSNNPNRKINKQDFSNLQPWSNGQYPTTTKHSNAWTVFIMVGTANLSGQVMWLIC